LRENAAIREWFRSEGVAELLEEQGRTRRVGRQLMTLLQFALWHRFFVETTTTELPETTDPLKLLAL